jgi:hypothetical protein
LKELVKRLKEFLPATGAGRYPGCSSAFTHLQVLFHGRPWSFSETMGVLLPFWEPNVFSSGMNQGLKLPAASASFASQPAFSHYRNKETFQDDL